jgi:cytochrome b561
LRPAALPRRLVPGDTQVPKTDRYDSVSMVLHWAMVLLILLLFGLGWYMVELPDGSPERTRFFALHKSVGLTTALFALVRIGWRLKHPAPPLPGTLPAWQRGLAHLTHVLLYVFMVVQPLSGYLSSSFSGYKTRLWGVPLPYWGWHDPVVNQLFTDIHVASSVALLCLILLHVAGALFHALTPRDNVLGRMLPFARAPAPEQN